MNEINRPARNFALSFISFLFSAIAVVALLSALATYGNRSVSGAPAPPTSGTKAKKTMRSFGSDEELKAYLRKLAEEQRRAQTRRAAEAPAQPTTANQAAATGLAKSADAAKDESITIHSMPVWTKAALSNFMAITW